MFFVLLVAKILRVKSLKTKN